MHDWFPIRPRTFNGVQPGGLCVESKIATDRGAGWYIEPSMNKEGVTFL